ncbi:terpene synthase family protein [Staphylococcus succinus]|nr:terpene synthase family protein [Staphylococcus succinus]
MGLLKELINSANKIANWTNDILSLDKEIRDGEVHNLVICIQKQND